MFVLKMAGLSILNFVGMVIFVVVIVFGTLLGYFSLQFIIFGREDYLLFVSDEINLIPVIMIMVLIIYAFFRLKEKFSAWRDKQTDNIEEDDDEPLDIEILSKREKFLFKLLRKLAELDETLSKIFRVVKICFISALLVAIYMGMTSYVILYNDSIKVSSPLYPKGVIYQYSNVKGVNVGVARSSRSSYTPYYKVIFNDGKSVDLLGGTAHDTKDKDFEYVLKDLDQKLMSQGASKIVDKENFEKYSKGLDKDFVRNVEKLFDN